MRATLLITAIILSTLASSLGQPIITTQPQSQTNVVGNTLTLAVEATGTEPLAYQWRRGGASVASATNTVLVFSNLQPSQAGNYTVVVTNIEGAVTSALAFVRVIVPPSITAQPTNVVADVGATASFAVSATGTAPLSYQWRFNDMNLLGKTNSLLTISDVQSTNGGRYAVVVANAAGAVTSQVTTLEVVLLRIIPSTSLQSKAVAVGTPASFTVTATGVPPFWFQWRLDGSDLTNQTNRTLAFNAVEPADEGDYTVLVSNVAGAVVSEPARLYVVPSGTNFIRGDFTNSVGLRLPFFLFPAIDLRSHSKLRACLSASWIAER
jgi:hypothetical protein